MKLLTLWVLPIFALSACALEVPEKSTQVSARPTATVASGAAPATNTFNGYVKENAPAMSILLTERDIFEMGFIMCQIAGDVTTPEAFTLMIALAMAESGAEKFQEEIAAVAAGALAFLCPEHSYLFKD
jgi:hypothetical protein